MDLRGVVGSDSIVISLHVRCNITADDTSNVYAFKVLTTLSILNKLRILEASALVYFRMVSKSDAFSGEKNLEQKLDGHL